MFGQAQKDPYPVGTRVYAVRDESADTVFIYGFGVYEGQKPIDKHLEMESPFGRVTVPSGTPNPRIKLDDSNEYVWGYECWWAKEDQFEEKFKGKKVVKVSIAETRREQEESVSNTERSIKRAEETVEAHNVSRVVGLLGGSKEFRHPRTGKPMYLVAAFIAYDSDGNIIDALDLKAWKEEEEAKAKAQAERDPKGN